MTNFAKLSTNGAQNGRLRLNNTENNIRRGEKNGRIVKLPSSSSESSLHFSFSPTTRRWCPSTSAAAAVTAATPSLSWAGSSLSASPFFSAASSSGLLPTFAAVALTPLRRQMTVMEARRFSSCSTFWKRMFKIKTSRRKHSRKKHSEKTRILINFQKKTQIVKISKKNTLFFW